MNVPHPSEDSNPFFSSYMKSQSISCSPDPSDDSYLLCTTKETSYDRSGQQRTSTRQERLKRDEQASQNLATFDFFGGPMLPPTGEARKADEKLRDFGSIFEMMKPSLDFSFFGPFRRPEGARDGSSFWGFGDDEAWKEKKREEKKAKMAKPKEEGDERKIFSI